MKNGYLNIKNFGPIRDICVELDRFMVFIGSQGSGKSTIAKLLTIFNDIYFWYKIVSKSNEMPEFKNMGLMNYFENDTTFEYFDPRQNVTIKYQKSSFEINIPGYRQDELKKTLTEEINKKIQSHLSAKNLSNLKDLNAMSKNILRSDLRFNCYIPAERNLAGIAISSLANFVLSGIPIPHYLLEYLALYEKANNGIDEFDASFLGVKYIKTNNKDNIKVRDGKFLSLQECSSGVQSALPLIMVLEYLCNEEMFYAYVIEEPEQNLFPSNQKEILMSIISNFKKNDQTRMIITTHSPYVLSTLNVCMLADKLAAHSDIVDSVNAIVKKENQLNRACVKAYALNIDSEGTIEDIIDNKTELISADYLDNVSLQIGNEFAQLNRLYLKVRSRQ